VIKTSTRPERRRAWLRPTHDWVNRADIILRNHMGMIVDRLPGQPDAGRSKYMPHIGKKQRAKGGAA